MTIEEMQKIPALSIRQPWAWLILNAGKDVENRNWVTSHRGRFLVHAAKGCTREEMAIALDFAGRVAGALRVPDRFETGGIVGVAEIVDCVRRHPSPWFVGGVGFVLRDPQPLPFVPCRGALGFFRPRFEAAPMMHTFRTESEAEQFLRRRIR